MSFSQVGSGKRLVGGFGGAIVFGQTREGKRGLTFDIIGAMGIGGLKMNGLFPLALAVLSFVGFIGDQKFLRLYVLQNATRQ